MNLLKKAKNLVWEKECEKAFWQLKGTLATLYVLSKPNTNKRLIVYLSVSNEAICAMLVQEEGGEVKSVYFVR